MNFFRSRLKYSSSISYTGVPMLWRHTVWGWRLWAPARGACVAHRSSSCPYRLGWRLKGQTFIAVGIREGRR